MARNRVPPPSHRVAGQSGKMDMEWYKQQQRQAREAAALSDLVDTAYQVGGTDVAVADGGTGASTAAAARTNLGVGLALLTSGTVSAAATLDLVLTSYTTFRGLIFELYGLIPATDAVDLYVRFSSDGGAAYDATGYNWVTRRDSDGAATALTGNNSDTEIQVVGSATIGSAATEGIDLTLKLMGQTATARWGRIRWDGYYIDDSATPEGRHIYGGGAREAAQDTDAIRFLFSSGNIASGSYAVYGLL